jgi:hypothetical protein
MQNTSEIPQLVDRHRDDLIGLANRVWAKPETLYGEYRSCAEHTAMLHNKGFRVTENVADIPTAVMGEAGHGGRVIAILGEFDALRGLSQVAGGLSAGAGCRCAWPWLWAQLAGIGSDAGGLRGQRLAGGDRRARARALLRLPC